ncbi:YlmH/Sll1252 family protein [Fructilactobacillus vespulae]|uniref:YlmH family RNA-binding protein n=1 Tax=Fructilactobacillus vespulae TaxID=1249630 RepID=UPI0039B56135
MAISENIQQHFRKSEIPFLRVASDWIEQANNEYRPILTGFLNNREIFLLNTLINRYPNLKLEANGGYQGAEMKRALIFPDYYAPSVEDYEIVPIQIQYPVKFAKLKHNQILGTLMGSGIERNVIGDIITDGEQWNFLAQKNMSVFLKQEVDHIGRVKVTLNEIQPTQLIKSKNESVLINLTLSSLRLDIVVASIFNVSRSIAKGLIMHDKVRLNWFTYNKPDNEISLHDMLSVRGYGRARLTANNGYSKKNKNKVEFEVIKNK